MKLFLKLFIAIFVTGLLASCASQPLANCSSLDWFELGRRDGSIGLLPTAFSRHTETCNGDINNDAQVRYKNGRNKGLISFCSAQSGWEVGRAGRAYQNVCPRSFEGGFRRGYEPGIKAFQIQKEIENISYQLRIDQLNLRQRYDLNRRLAVLESELQSLKKPAPAGFQFESASSN